MEKDESLKILLIFKKNVKIYKILKIRHDILHNDIFAFSNKELVDYWINNFIEISENKKMGNDINGRITKRIQSNIIQRSNQNRN